VQLLQAKIPKAQKGQSSHQCLFALLVSAHAKAAQNMLLKLTQVVNFSNMFMCSFYKQRFQKRKKDSQVISVFLRFWYLHMQKLLKTCC
jgi:hypothetical protein